MKSMVRKAVRPYSAVLQDFEEIDVKDKKLRAFYQPLSKEVLHFVLTHALMRTHVCARTRTHAHTHTHYFTRTRTHTHTHTHTTCVGVRRGRRQP